MDSQGNIRLRSIFLLEQDTQFVYNLTISARDTYGLESFTNVAIFLNVMSIVKLKQPYPLECLINGARSELDLSDRKTLNPPLFVTVSLTKTKPELQPKNINQSILGKFNLFAQAFSSPVSSEPSGAQHRRVHRPGLSQITSFCPYTRFRQVAKKVFPSKIPLRLILLRAFRITLTVQVFQLQPLDENLFLSSIVCKATIYLQKFNSSTVAQRPPYFLSQYSATVDRESVNKSVPLIKIDAISMVPNSMTPIGFRILNNEYSDLFIIDMMQGFIYPRYDLSLAPKTYVIKVGR